VDNDDGAVVQPHQKILGLPVDTDDLAALEAVGKSLGQGNPQVGSARHGPHDGLALEIGCEATPDSFDFGKFRHTNNVAVSDGFGYGLVMPEKVTKPATDRPPERVASFGFRDVPEEDKSGLVRSVFDSVAPQYDLMNDLMSGGIHRLWKRALIDQLRPRPGMTLLDVGGGTGDIAFRFMDRGGQHAIVYDINQHMLEVGRDRGLDHGYLHDIDWMCGDAEAVPLESGSVDAYTIAFCLRNVTRRDRVLAEAYRVLKPGGRFQCLEFSHVVVPLLSEIYDTYSFRLLPFIGKVVANDREAYQYLVESIRRFPDQGTLAGEIRDAGFDRVGFTNLSGGIAAIHAAWHL